jgi:hypothetical protein
MKIVLKHLVGTAALLLIMGWSIPVAHAWCDPGDLVCGAIVDSNVTLGHDDINTYNCTGSTHWNGKAHVYRIYPTEDSLLITLNWSAPDEDRLHLFLLTDCNASHCIAEDADTIAAAVTPGQDYWIIVDSKRDNTVHYTLRVICSDHPLPVEMTSFDAVMNGGQVDLTWTVASELNNSGFDIEREQPDVAPWEHIGFVAGRGTSSSAATYHFTDANVTPQTPYIYRLISVDINGVRASLGTASVNRDRIGEPALVSGFELNGNYPNPFNPSTTIRFEVAESMPLSLDVFDISGRFVTELASGVFEVGSHEISFDGSATPSGVYFARLTGETQSQLLKMVLLK